MTFDSNHDHNHDNNQDQDQAFKIPDTAGRRVRHSLWVSVNSQNRTMTMTFDRNHDNNHDINQDQDQDQAFRITDTSVRWVCPCL